MDDLYQALLDAFSDYRKDIDSYERRRKPTDGLFGLGRSLRDDPCHERFDERVAGIVAALCALPPAPDDVARAVTLLLGHDDGQPWPLAAEWMLRAIERHALPLIPHLCSAAAADLARAYARRYKRYDRLPAQQQVYKALKAAAEKDK